VPQRGLKVLRKKMPQRKASEMGREALIEATINGESGGACDRLDHGKTMFQMVTPMQPLLPHRRSMRKKNRKGRLYFGLHKASVSSSWRSIHVMRCVHQGLREMERTL